MSDSLSQEPIHKLIRSQTILLIDDTTHLKKVILGVFRGIGAANYLHIDNVDQAFKVLSHQKVTSILCDLEGTHERGLSFIKRLRAAPRPEMRDIPVILVQTDATATSVAAAREAGATEVLAPPISLAAVEAKFRSIICGRSRPSVDEYLNGIDRRKLRA